MTGKTVKKEEQNVATQVQKFVADSIMFYQKCKKPDYTEYMKILQACIMGFFIMGAIGYFIKLVFIPINNIILSWTTEQNSYHLIVKKGQKLSNNCYADLIYFKFHRMPSVGQFISNFVHHAVKHGVTLYQLRKFDIFNSI